MKEPHAWSAAVAIWAVSHSARSSAQFVNNFLNLEVSVRIGNRTPATSIRATATSLMLQVIARSELGSSEFMQFDHPLPHGAATLLSSPFLVFKPYVLYIQFRSLRACSGADLEPLVNRGAPVRNREQRLCDRCNDPYSWETCFKTITTASQRQSFSPTWESQTISV